MKNRNRIIGCFVSLTLIVTLMACASTSNRESTGQYIDNSVITTKVKSLLANDDFLKSFQISVKTYKGEVQLSGFVNSAQASTRAVELTKSVDGVKSVNNSLLIK